MICSLNIKVWNIQGNVEKHLADRLILLVEKVNGQVLSAESLMHDLEQESIYKRSHRVDLAPKFTLREWCTQKLIKKYVDYTAVTSFYGGKLEAIKISAIVKIWNNSWHIDATYWICLFSKDV